jgi:acyl-CoA synthetase (AMP-forming)/AMP-acid ligase II
MNLLRENAVHRDLSLLHKAWSDAESFLLVPDKLSVNGKWLTDAMSSVPESLRDGHFIMLTSGTTGNPKLIIGDRRRAEQLATVLHKHQHSEPVRESLVLLPLSYTYAFVNQWLWAHTHQRALRITAGLSDPKALGETLAAASHAMICLVGVQVPLLLHHLGAATFPGVIRIHFAGGRFPQERLPELRAMFPNAEVFNNYGCAEAMPRLALRRAEDVDDSANIGLPLPGIELKSGEGTALMFRSPYGAVGIVEDGRFSAIGRDDWVPTGDLGEKTENGSWRLLGRASEVFKRHGEKVSLQSLASTVTEVWSGQCAFYRERDRLGEDGCVLTVAPPANAQSLQQLLLALRKQHRRAHWPLRIEAVHSLPLLSNRKPDLRALRDFPAKTTLWQQHI